MNVQTSAVGFTSSSHGTALVAVADGEEQTRRSRVDFLAQAEGQQIHRKRRSARVRHMMLRCTIATSSPCTDDAPA
jgi:hypothetical protein